jgi:cyclopropane-fatty-acyl-phospholipid synthase
MGEHVGERNYPTYAQVLHDSVRPGGHVLVQQMSLTGRYVFPDGELLDVSETVGAMEAAGFEVRDVHSLREHYARTLRHWVANLQSDWDRAVALVGEARARIWRLYMAASAIGFDDGGVSIHQVLGVVPTSRGGSGLPATRDRWCTTSPGA